MRTNWGFAVLVLVLVGCGNIEEVDSPALMRSTDIAGSTGGAAGAPGTGGMPGAGGMTAGAGGAAGAGTGGAAGYTCADLLACCDSLTNPSQAQLQAQCLTVYNSAMTGTTSCGTALAMIKLNGLCP